MRNWKRFDNEKHYWKHFNGKSTNDVKITFTKADKPRRNGKQPS